MMMVTSPMTDATDSPDAVAPSPGRVTFAAALNSRRKSSVGTAASTGSPGTMAQSSRWLTSAEGSTVRPQTAPLLTAGECPVLDAVVARYNALITAIGFNPRADPKASSMAASGVGGLAASVANLKG